MSGAQSSPAISPPMDEVANTGERPQSKARDQIIREAKRLEETTLHSFKGHHCAASDCKDLHLRLGIPTVIISALVGAAAFSKIASENSWVGFLAGGLSVVVAVLSAITTFLNPNEKQNAHLNAAHGFDKLNNDSRIFWSIECGSEPSDDVLSSKLKSLVDKKNELNASSPQIPNKAYRRGKKGIEDGEATFKVDTAPEAKEPPLSISYERESAKQAVDPGTIASRAPHCS